MNELPDLQAEDEVSKHYGHQIRMIGECSTVEVSYALHSFTNTLGVLDGVQKDGDAERSAEHRSLLPHACTL